jgi:hypothetical protein
VSAAFCSSGPVLNPIGERRGNDRYPIVRDVRYKIISGRGEPDSGLGKTVDVSSRGVLFTSQKPLPPGKRVELSISWPAQLDGKCALKLVARGRITRCRGNHVAVEIDKYEFRTQGSRSLGAANSL